MGGAPRGSSENASCSGRTSRRAETTVQVTLEGSLTLKQRCHVAQTPPERLSVSPDLRAQAAGSPEGIETEALEHGGWAGRSSEAARGAAAAVAWSWLVLLRCRTCPDCHSASAGRREGPGRYGAGHYGGGGGSTSRNVRARLYLLPTTVDSYQSELTVNAAVQTGYGRRAVSPRRLPVFLNHRSHRTVPV